MMLLYICDYKYTTETVTIDMLRDNDRLRANILRDLCSRRNIGFHVASLERIHEGQCESYCGDADYYAIESTTESTITLTRVVDFNGRLVTKDLPVDENDNIIQRDLFGNGPDDQEYERYHGLVTHYYRDTVGYAEHLKTVEADRLQVLVMFPSNTKDDFILP